MPCIDITNEFRQVVQEKQRDVPEGKRRKLDHAKRSPTTSPDSTGAAGKEYINEGYTVVRPLHHARVDSDTK
jgi:syntaxin 18